MRFLRRGLTGVFLAAVTLGLLVWAAALLQQSIATRMQEGGGTGPAREAVYNVRTVHVLSGTEQPVIETFGEIRAGRAVELRAGIAGRITDLAPTMREGGQAAAGAVLARIDPAGSEAARDTAAADLAEVEADLDEARRAVPLAQDDLAVALEQADLQALALARQQDLDARGVGSVSAVQEAALAEAEARARVVSRRQALAQAEARLARLGAARDRAAVALREADRRLADTVVVAPFAGTLAEVTAVAGGLVAENEALAQLIDPAQLDVGARLSAAQYARLVGGDGRLRDTALRVVLPAGGDRLEAAGRIDRDAARVGTGGVGRDVFAALDAPAGFKPGDIVTVLIDEPPLDQVARLPAQAVDVEGRVLVLGPDERLEAGRVAVLRRQGDTVLVQAGDLDGAEIVARQRPELGPGIRVRRIDSGPAAAGLDEPTAAAPAAAQGG